MKTLSAQSQIDLPMYAALFEPKSSLISGDITPGYSTLPDEIVGKIVGHFPNLKVIFIARDPVERAWSQLSMWVRHGLINRSDLNDADVSCAKFTAAGGGRAFLSEQDRSALAKVCSSGTVSDLFL